MCRQTFYIWKGIPGGTHGGLRGVFEQHYMIGHLCACFHPCRYAQYNGYLFSLLLYYKFMR